MAQGSMQRAHYRPPWADTSIIGVAGSSGSGKTSLALAIVSQLSLPWVVVLSMVTPSDTNCSRVRTLTRGQGFVLQSFDARAVQSCL